MSEILIIIVGFAATIFTIWYLLSRWQQKEAPKMLEQLFAKSATLVTQQNQSLLSREQDRIQADLEKQSRQMEGLVRKFETTLEQKHQELKVTEKERAASYANLVAQLEEQRRAVGELQISTKKITELLDHNQSRGAWGESIIEDLLTANGLVEGTHYVRQRMIDGTQYKPDISLLLPEKATIAVDVKFPLAELISLQKAGSEENRKSLTKKFGETISLHIDKVSEYIQPTHNTLDFSIMFIPSEMIFSFINQELSAVVNHAMQKKVLLVSPFTLIVVALTIRESYRNFKLSDTLRQAATSLQGFMVEWEKSKEAWQKHGKLLDQLQRSHEEIVGPRARQLEKRAMQIDRANKGALKWIFKTQK